MFIPFVFFEVITMLGPSFVIIHHVMFLGFQFLTLLLTIGLIS